MVDALESSHVSFVGHCDLDGEPAFKMALERFGDRWYLYMANLASSGWSIADVTEPAAPELVTQLDGPANTMTKQVQVADGRMITSLEEPYKGYGPRDDPMDPAEPYEEGAYIWDLTDDPLEPEVIGHYGTGGMGTHRNFYTGGRYVYMCAQPAEFAEIEPTKNFMLTVVDIDDPSEPEEVGRWWWPGQSKHDEEEAEETFYFHGPAYVRGDRAYLSYGRKGLVTLDVSDPTEPELVCQMGIGDGVGNWLGVHSFVPIPGTNLAAANTEVTEEGSPLDDDGGTMDVAYLVNIADEGPPHHEPRQGATGYRVVSSLPVPVPDPHLPYQNYFEKAGRFGPHNQHHPRGEPTRYRTSDYLFMAYTNAGLRIYDISDPLAPREAGHFVPVDPPAFIGDRLDSGPVGHFEDVLVDSRGYIYCTDVTYGLIILESDLL